MTLVSGDIYTEPTPPDGPIHYSDYMVDTSDPLVGGAGWFDGQYLPASEISISALDGGFNHSYATYTVVHVWHGNYFRLSDHLDRFLEGAALMRLTSPLSKAELVEICHEVVRRSQVREAYVSVSLTLGINGRIGQDVSFAKGPQIRILAGPYGWIFDPFQQVAGVSAIVPKTTRRSLVNQVNPQIKNYQWFDLVAGEHEASDRGAQTAILLDQNGFVAEGPGFNVLVVKDGKMSTPGASALPGITRRTALEIAEAAGIETSIRDVTEQELYEADEIILTTTAGGVTPVITLDDRPVGAGVPGPIGTLVQNRYWALMDEPSDLIEPVTY